MTLYHGSNMEIEDIDLDKCRPFKDFGRGFYLTSLKEQAKNMAENTSRIYGGMPVVTIYEIDDRIFYSGELSIRIFPNVPTIEWALFIYNNRRREGIEIENSECNKDNKYDIVIGPVADDKIAVTLRRYMGDKIDIEGLKKQFTYHKLTDQYSFHTLKAIQHLKKAGVLNE